jgi:hypothetical protein
VGQGMAGELAASETVGGWLDANYRCQDQVKRPIR